ncbi:adenylate/guanylate cyclase domain-containing protein [bacterium]|nr:adenylate/guanylate cyclase domain-containing protein [bacterium]
MDKRYKKFLKLLDKRNANKNNSGEIDKLIKEKFERKFAVVITDSSHFTYKTKTFGIIQYLAVLQESYKTLNKIIENNKGTLIKEWADDIFAVFANPDDALSCVLKMQKYLDNRNKSCDESEKFTICAGISYGNILYLGDDIFGDPVNIASKLGEDTAEKDEILLSEDAYNGLKNKDKYKFERVKDVKMSGVKIDYYKLQK